MILKPNEYNLNDYFINPFKLRKIKIEAPFEKVIEDKDIDRLNSNFVVDYVLFTYKLMFIPFLKTFLENDKIIIQIERGFPNLRIDYQPNEEEDKKKGFYVTKIYKSMAFEIEKVRRKELTGLLPDKKILKMEKKHLFVVNFGNMKIRNELLNEKIDIETEEVEKELKLKVEEFSTKLLEYIGNPQEYPFYEKQENEIKINFDKMKEF